MEDQGNDTRTDKHDVQPFRPVWYSRLSINNDEIVQLIIDGVDVRGVITHRSAGDIEVEITRPYQNISSGWHIPYFGRQLYSYQTPYGDYTARGMLKGLYVFAAYLDTNMDVLREKLSTIKQTFATLVARVSQEDAIGFRRRQREGESGEVFDIEDDEEELRKVAARRKHLKEMRYKITCDFFKDNFPWTLPNVNREEVLDILEGKKELNAAWQETANCEEETNDTDEKSHNMLNIADDALNPDLRTPEANVEDARTGHYSKLG
jgi:hypothetical protein